MRTLEIRRWATGAAAILIGSRALASTYVVDMNGGPGVDFTDLPPAIAAAQPGDVLQVMPGDYSAFTCSQGLMILGYGDPTVSGTARFSDLPSGSTAALVGVTPTRLEVDSCNSPVLVQDASGIVSVDIEYSTDVRLLDVGVTGGGIWGQTGIRVFHSRVEIVDSTVSGGFDPTRFLPCPVYGGGIGLEIQGSLSRVHLSRSEVLGGPGPQFCTGGIAGSGGPGVYVTQFTKLLIAGGGVGRIQGGEGGYGWRLDCSADGLGGAGVSALLAHVTHSRVDVEGGSYAVEPCFDAQAPAFAGSWISAYAPEHATLSLRGTPTSAHAVRLTVTGPPESRARMWLGRSPVLTPRSDADVELLAPRVKTLDLGWIPSSGSITVPVEIPGSYAAGDMIVAQAECSLPSGRVRRTNSVPLVVR